MLIELVVLYRPSSVELANHNSKLCCMEPARLGLENKSSLIHTGFQEKTKGSSDGWKNSLPFPPPRDESCSLRHTAGTLPGSPERNSKAKGLFPDLHPTQQQKPHTVPLAGLITAWKSTGTPEESGQGKLEPCIRIGAATASNCDREKVRLIPLSQSARLCHWSADIILFPWYQTTTIRSCPVIPNNCFYGQTMWYLRVQTVEASNIKIQY